MKDNANENLDALGVDEIIDLEEFSKKDKVVLTSSEEQKRPCGSTKYDSPREPFTSY